jgi:ATP-dependent RNA helicase DDX60
VDLIGDYAGDELFIIEGDSLLLHSFSDEKLDFSPGLQLLHATYTVENFLRALLQRKCNFHVVFFSKHARMCVPQNTPIELYSRYLLAREAIIQHLSYNLPLAVPSIQVKAFDTYRSRYFQEYLESRGAYFFMCHDGSFSRSDIADKYEGSRKDHDGDTECPKGASQTSLDRTSLPEHGEEIFGKESLRVPRLEYLRKVTLRSMIHWFICRGYNIALITSVECRDTKVSCGSPPLLAVQRIEGNLTIAATGHDNDCGKLKKESATATAYSKRYTTSIWRLLDWIPV